VNLLILTARFLDNRYHGLLTKKGPPEWPPSPYRLFQALVSGVARRGELVEGEDVLNNKNLTPVGQALDWLQKHTSIHPPVIIAPRSKAYQEGDGVIRFVPNNDDGTHFHPELHRVAKPTIPTLFLLEPDQKPEVHYAWDISDAPDAPADHIRDAARSLTTLGWGIDMAFADARLATGDDVQKLKGIRWYPKKNAGSFRDTLRTPTYDAETGECTLCDLRHCHSTFINRIEHGKPLKTVDKPKIFDRVLYTSVERPARRLHAVFKLLDPNEDPARYPHAKLVHIAGMVRHLAIKAMTDAEADADFVNRVVRGKREPSAGDDHKQFSYVPLPSIGHEHADGIIRNVMLVAPIGMERELTDLAHRIDGQPLKPEGEFGECKSDLSPTEVYRAELRLFTPPANKFIDTHYLGTSRIWQTVTPVILDGHNKKSKTDKPDTIARETEKLICKALQRAGIETPCKFTWQAIPFLKNCLSAHKYDRNGRHTGYHRPTHLKDMTAVHVQLTFDHPIPGPLAIGAGRHCGLGTFTAVK
jgi:CRISPR-associated protein Csb2